MYKKNVLTALFLTLALLLVSCGGEEAGEETETEPIETNVEETVETAAETEETAKETTPPVNFTNFKKLTVTEDTKYQDGKLYITFSETNVRLLEQDACAIGISGGGEAWSIGGTLDLAASEIYKDGETYTGMVVTPAEALETGKYKFTVTVADYLMGFSLTIG